MCYVAQRSPLFRANQQIFTKDELSPREQRALERLRDEFEDVLDGPERSLLARIERGEVSFDRLDEVRTAVRDTFGDYQEEITATIREGSERAAVAGRETAGRQFDLEIEGSFSVLPERLIDNLDANAIESSNEVIDTMSDDIARVLRSEAEDGASVGQMSQTLQEDVFDNRLKEHKAEEVAQTHTTRASNAGADETYREAEGVIGKEWLASGDGATRDAHRSADGQIAPVDGTFLVGGERMEHPGDVSASIELWIRCRCGEVPVHADQLDPGEVETILDGGRLNA